MRRTLLALLGPALLLCGCDLAPPSMRPSPAVPAAWPVGDAYAPASGPAVAPALRWQALVVDAKLRAVIAQTLAGNQDLRQAIANVAAARAQYHVQRSYELPTLSAGGTATLVRGTPGNTVNQGYYDADLGSTSFEIDLFHQLRNLSREAFETYLATRSGMEATRITLVSETATAYATYAADRDLLALARQTAQSGQRSLDLTQALLQAGLGSALDVQNAATVVEQANADAASDTAQLAQDRNALELLAGGPVADSLLPDTLDAVSAGIAVVPAGLSSTVLLRRPDVRQAEHTLQAANFNIGAARAAFFPTLTLTSTLGIATSAAATAFTGGVLNALVTPTISMPLLGGPTAGNLQYARAERDADIAAYRSTIQTAFKEVANALARRGVIDTQQAAETRLVQAASNAQDLAQAQYQAGTGDYLDVLTAQRTLYADRQGQIAVTLTDLSSRINLYAALAPEGPA